MYIKYNNFWNYRKREKEKITPVLVIEHVLHHRRFYRTRR